MVRRVLFLVLAAGLVLVPSVAKADQLIFQFGCKTSGGNCIPGESLAQVSVGIGGLISNQIPGAKQKVSLSTLFSAKHAPSGPSITGANLGTVGFTTGAWISGTKTSSVLMYAAGGDIKVNGNCSNASACGSLFTGVFSGPVTFTVTTIPIPGHPPDHRGVLSGMVKTTSLSSTLLAALGLPFQGSGTVVSILVDLRVGTGGQIQSGTITLVPEPGTLALFGTGLIGLAGLIRRRLR